jgi:hypothetical protein
VIPATSSWRRVVTWLICFFGPLTAVVTTAASADVVGDLRAKTPADSIALRQKLVQSIWGAPTPEVPTVQVEPTSGINTGETFGREPLEMRWLVSDMGKGMRARTLYAHFQHGASCLLVINAGHSQGFVQPPPANLKPPVSYWAVPGSMAFLKRVVAEGCDLIMVSMPFYGENRGYALDVGLPMEPPSRNLHDDMPKVQAIKPDKGSLLRYFLEPAMGSLQWALRHRSYLRIGMAGLSGGGWATTVLAALEPSVQVSYAVSGSVPMKYRATPREGDWEQYTSDLLDVADYSDLYLMGTAEQGRRVHLLYNAENGCCFNGTQVQQFAPALVKFANEAGYGPLEVKIFPGSAHDIQPAIADHILADFMHR